MIACTAMVQAGQIAPATVERLEGDLDAFTRDAFDAPATIAWVEVEAGNGFTKGEPSTTSVVSVSAPAALEQGRRVDCSTLSAPCGWTPRSAPSTRSSPSSPTPEPPEEANAMPLYICRPPRGALTPEGKTAIAAAITSIHCAVTDAPPVFVHAFFFEHDGGEGSPGAGRTALHGTIRAGRTDAQRAEIADRLQAAVRGIAGVASETVDVTLSETPASRVMEGGEIFPEPGEEAAWLVQHEARMAAAASA